MEWTVIAGIPSSRERSCTMLPEQAGSLVIRMDGAFDIDSVQVIRSRIADLPGESEVYVDLSRVREFHDRAVAMLAEVLAATRARVSVRGLRQHQYRMLRYLGVTPSSLDPGLARASSSLNR
jgi:ABC-type transporter Mla MlaB component